MLKLCVCSCCRACCFHVLSSLPCPHRLALQLRFITEHAPDTCISESGIKPSPMPAPAGLKGRRPSHSTSCPGMCTLQVAACAFQYTSAPSLLQGQLEGRGAAQRGWPLRGSLMVSVPDDGLTSRPSMTTVDRDRGISVVSGLAALPSHSAVSCLG